MNLREFGEQMDRLKNVYGDKAYPKERIELIWKNVGSLSALSFSRVVDDLISSFRNAPMAQEFSEALSKERERTAANVIRPDIPAWNAPARCWSCKDTGCFVCVHPVKPGLWAFRCACDKGLNDPRTHIPFFVQQHISEGFTYFDVQRKA